MPRALSFVLLGAAIAGCAHEAAADRQLHEMKETIGKVQVEQDRENRAFMEEPAPVASARPAAAKTPALPPPRTVQLDDGADDGASADPDDPTARPEIKLQGSGGGAVRPARRATESPRSDGPRAFDPEAKRMYEDGIHLVQAKSFDRALDVLSTFLSRWPDHPYVENALYWKGECLYARGEYLRAAEQFEAVVTRYGAGKKGADALLKLGMCHDRLGASDRAREYWDRLRRDFPHSDVTKKIPAGETNRGSGPKETR
ncbi:MAG: tol-pal system protein YbgF [Labilithrix sp.]|nr:tol-pal system protein YbgF [Labilithrix sp.]MCW5817848.1 tol-pal system protein YbgF [Labilithrix sp.]